MSDSLLTTTTGLPTNAVGVAPNPETPLNVRIVNSDAELREALVQAGSQTVRALPSYRTCRAALSFAL